MVKTIVCGKWWTGVSYFIRIYPDCSLVFCCRIFIFGALGYFKLGNLLAVVTFSVSESAPVPKFFYPDSVSSEISDFTPMCACTEWYSTYQIRWENCLL